MESLEENQYLRPTPLLDYESPILQTLVQQKGWKNLSSISAQIDAVYTFVRDAIPFGYSKAFAISGSEVLKLGLGNCLTKTILLMTLLRAVGVPCRMKAGMVDKVLHRGLLGSLAYRLSPDTLFHGWVNIFYNDRWIEIGGHIVDRPYLLKLLAKYPDYMGSFYGYGIAVLNFRNPPIHWEEGDTFIQSKARAGTLGTYDDPDAFFQAYPEAQERTRSLRYQKILRPTLNKSIVKLRQS